MKNETNESTGTNSSVFLWTGVTLLVLGILGVIFPYFASAFIVFVIGVILLIGGVLFLVAAYKGGEGFWANLLIGITLLVISIVILVYPGLPLLLMTFLMALFFVILGIFSIVVSVKMRPEDGWWGPMVSGILALILGVLLFVGWPGNSEFIIGLFVGIEFIFEGVALMIVGFMSK